MLTTFCVVIKAISANLLNFADMNDVKIIVKPGNRLDVARIVREELGDDVRVLHHSDGSPLLAGSPLHISISHSHHYVALALHPSKRIGIDIEEPRLEQLRRVMSKFINPDELPMWGHRLLEAWTAKEAAFKAAGVQGIGLASINLAEPGVAKVPDGRRFELYTTITPEYTLTLAL